MTDDEPLTRDIAPFGLRMQSDLKERVKEAAKSNNRSMNAEIVATLEEKYPSLRVKRLDVIRAFLELELDDQLELVELAEADVRDPQLGRVLRAFFDTQKKVGEKIPSDHLDAIIDHLKKTKR